MNNLPSIGQACWIQLGDKVVAGHCQKNRCNYDSGPLKGQPSGLGKMRGIDGKSYWIEPGNVNFALR